MESEYPLDARGIADGKRLDDCVMFARRLLDAGARPPLAGRRRGGASAQIGDQIDQLAVVAQPEQLVVEEQIRLVLLEDRAGQNELVEATCVLRQPLDRRGIGIGNDAVDGGCFENAADLGDLRLLPALRLEHVIAAIANVFDQSALREAIERLSDLEPATAVPFL